MYIYIYIYISYLTLSPSSGNGMSKSPPAAHDSHSFRQFRQLPPSLHQQFTQLTQPAAQATKERVLHPVVGGQSTIRPRTPEVGLKPMASASSQAKCAVQANRKGASDLVVALFCLSQRPRQLVNVHCPRVAPAGRRVLLHARLSVRHNVSRPSEDSDLRVQGHSPAG